MEYTQVRHSLFKLCILGIILLILKLLATYQVLSKYVEVINQQKMVIVLQKLFGLLVYKDKYQYVV